MKKKCAVFKTLDLSLWNVTYAFVVYCSSWLLQVRQSYFVTEKLAVFFWKIDKNFVKQSHDDITTTIIYFKGSINSSQPSTRTKKGKQKNIPFSQNLLFPHSFNNQQFTIKYSQHQPRFDLTIKFTLSKRSYRISLTVTTIITPVLITVTSFWWSSYLQPTITTL